VISLRYHVVSLAAVFLALALGVVLGSAGLSDPLLGVVSGQRNDLAGKVNQLTAERDALAAGERSADEFGGAVAPLAVRGQLANRPVVLITAPGADPADRDAIGGLVRQAGGSITGEVALTEAVTDPARADQLRELVSRLLPSGAQLPSASDPGSLSGGMIGAAVLLRDGKPQATPQGTAAALTGLAEAGFIKPGPAPAQAQLVVLLTGGSMDGRDAPDRVGVLSRMAMELDRAGAGAVLAGRAGSAAATGAVGVARADGAAGGSLSTVDNVQSAAGRVATVLALREQAEGRAGKYGVGEGVTAPVPGGLA
jgi:Copper transport outer membrane protein, MctB